MPGRLEGVSTPSNSIPPSLHKYQREGGTRGIGHQIKLVLVVV